MGVKNMQQLTITEIMILEKIKNVQTFQDLQNLKNSCQSVLNPMPNVVIQAFNQRYIQLDNQ